MDDKAKAQAFEEYNNLLNLAERLAKIGAPQSIISEVKCAALNLAAYCNWWKGFGYFD